jgi:hypothetical protein
MIKAKSRDTGDVGYANAIIVLSGGSGPTPLAFDDETYEGPWLPPFAPLSLIKPSDDPAIDYRAAELTSDRGNTLRCELQYTFERLKGSGFCLNDNTGEIFDLTIK